MDGGRCGDEEGNIQYIKGYIFKEKHAEVTVAVSSPGGRDTAVARKTTRDWQHVAGRNPNWYANGVRTARREKARTREKMLCWSRDTSAGIGDRTLRRACAPMHAHSPHMHPHTNTRFKDRARWILAPGAKVLHWNDGIPWLENLNSKPAFYLINYLFNYLLFFSLKGDALFF